MRKGFSPVIQRGKGFEGLSIFESLFSEFIIKLVDSEERDKKLITTYMC